MHRHVKGVTVIAVLVAGAVVAMLARPEWTPRIIPLICLILVGGFTTLAVVSLSRVSTSDTHDKGKWISDRSAKSLMAWLFGFLAMLMGMRALLAIAAMQENSWKTTKLFSPIGLSGVSMLFGWLSYSIGKFSGRRNDPKSAEK